MHSFCTIQGYSYVECTTSALRTYQTQWSKPFYMHFQYNFITWHIKYVLCFIIKNVQYEVTHGHLMVASCHSNTTPFFLHWSKPGTSCHMSSYLHWHRLSCFKCVSFFKHFDKNEYRYNNLFIQDIVNLELFFFH